MITQENQTDKKPGSIYPSYPQGKPESTMKESNFIQ